MATTIYNRKHKSLNPYDLSLGIERSRYNLEVWINNIPLVEYYDDESLFDIVQ